MFARRHGDASDLRLRQERSRRVVNQHLITTVERLQAAMHRILPRLASRDDAKPGRNHIHRVAKGSHARFPPGRDDHGDGFDVGAAEQRSKRVREQPASSQLLELFGRVRLHATAAACSHENGAELGFSHDVSRSLGARRPGAPSFVLA